MNTHRTFRLLASLLLILGILAGSDLTSLHAQKSGTFEKKGERKPPEPRKGPRPLPPPPAAAARPVQPPQPSAAARFQFKIDPKTPLKDLLPPPPRTERTAGPVRGNNLSRVPEVQFEAPYGSTNGEAIKHIAHQIAKINHLNDKKADGFIEALRSERPDLIGLPFAMGDACRTKGERSKQFARAVATVRQRLQHAGEQAIVRTLPVNFLPEHFWENYSSDCTEEDTILTHIRCEQRELIALTRIAALTQILLPMTQMHPGLVKYLSTVSHVEATRALARLAIFSADENARKAAIEALKVRRERDYTEVLVNGLRYPWPAVARRAALAITKLERNDLVPQLIEVLEQPDPRAPMTQEVKGKSVPVVRELVRVNHHRSCLLCHAPGNTGKVSADAVTAGVPVPGQPLNPPSGGYNNSQPDIVVRVDVTYLRQDFSALQAVADANPWPEMQRFDFLVRTRVLSDQEAASYCEKLKPREPGEFSPYHRAALAALRELTGRDTEPTPEAWRRLLKLSAETHRKPTSS